MGTSVEPWAWGRKVPSPPVAAPAPAGGRLRREAQESAWWPHSRQDAAVGVREGQVWSCLSLSSGRGGRAEDTLRLSFRSRRVQGTGGGDLRLDQEQERGEGEGVRSQRGRGSERQLTSVSGRIGVCWEGGSQGAGAGGQAHTEASAVTKDNALAYFKK